MFWKHKRAGAGSVYDTYIRTIIKGHNETALSNAILISRAAAVRERSPGEVARSENYKSPAIVVGAFYTLFRAAPENPETTLHAHVKRASSVWPCIIIYVYTYNVQVYIYVVVAADII